MNPIFLLAAAGGAAFFFLRAKKPAFENCGRLEIKQSMITQEVVNKIVKIAAAAGPNAKAIDFLGSVLRIYFPQCKFSRTTRATILAADEGELDWQEAVRVIGEKTLEEAERDPDVIKLLGTNKPQLEGNTQLAWSRLTGAFL